MKAKITILGCGNSTGVPAAGNHWGACDPNEPKNRRSRASIAVQTEKTTIIVDTGPDFREQMNRADIKALDAVLYTHAHSDHINGVDDLRGIAQRNKKLVPVYGNAWTIAELQERWRYLFQGDNYEGIYPPIVAPHVIENFHRPMTIGGITFTPFEQDHGSLKTVGYRFGDFGYSTDMSGLDAGTVETLKGIKVWVVDGCGYKNTASKVHATLEKIYALNRDIGAGKVYITSLSLAMDYETLSRELPSGYAPAFDGMAVEIKL